MSYEIAVDLAIWLCIAITLVWLYFRKRDSGVGLVLIFVAQFGITHWLPAVPYVLPWYTPFYDPRLVQLGFRHSLFGLAAFAFGAVVIGPGVWTHRTSEKKTHIKDTSLETQDDLWRKVYLVVGLAAGVAFVPFLGTVPTLSTALSHSGKLVLAGLTLSCWKSIQAQDRHSLMKWLLLSMLWPILTIVDAGHIKSGFDMFLPVLIFVVYLSGRSRRYFAVLLLIGYLFISLYITYYINRSDIRAVVWGSEDNLVQRVHTINTRVDRFELFDVFDSEHLLTIDKRFNQNFLTGSTIYRLSHNGDYANGETIRDAFLILIPRIIWRNKPVQRGGQSIVNQYAGVYFYGATSSPPGHVMEFYLNFGTLGVLIGLGVLGALISIIDRIAAAHLHTGKPERFALWYLPALSLLQPDNSFIALTGASVSMLLTVICINFIVHYHLRVSKRKFQFVQSLPPRRVVPDTMFQPDLENLRLVE